MKFFTVINRYGNNGDSYAHLSSVYGPYNDDEEVRRAIGRLWPNKESVEALVFDAEIFLLNTLTKEQSSQNGRHIRKNGEWTCRDCGIGLAGAVVYNNSAEGEAGSAVVLYCPNCDRKPEREMAPDYRREPIFSE